MTQSALNSRIKLITTIATLVLFALILVIVFQYVRLANLKAEAKQLEESKAKYEKQIEELNIGTEKRETRTYLEQYARDELGMIKEGEELYIFK